MKYFGKIAFRDVVETEPGIWEPQLTVREYYGDVLRSSRRLQDTSTSTNDDVRLNHQISIVADQFAYNHFTSILYVEYLGVKWKASDVEAVSPRLNITLGGEYNGDQGPQTDSA